MKKHSLIIIVIAIAGILFGLSLLISKDVFGPSAEVKPKKMNIDERVDSLGKLPFNEDSLLTIEGDINTLASINKINSSKKSSLLANLEYAKQNALVISLKNWLNNSCNSSEIDKVVRVGSTCSNKSNELQDLLNVHGRYHAVLSYNSKLNAFLSGEYNQATADALINGISSAVSGEPFSNCSAISGLQSKVNSEIASFKNFVEQEYIQAETANNWFKIDPAQIGKYSFYNKKYLENLEKLK
jgi:hypothetical protein